MASRLIPVALVLTLLGCPGLGAQTRVRTETITPPAEAAPAAPTMPGGPAEAAAQAPPAAKPNGRVGAAAATAVIPEIVTDLTQLPAPVARMRTRIIEAARTGDLDKVVTVMQSNETMPIFSFGDDKSPIAYWTANYPDSGGLEVLAILIEILETGFVHVDVGTPQEMYVWPYFAYAPLKSLSPAQKVELFKIVTGSDYKEMQDFGAYIFYRLGIGPDGTWHFFVTGD